MKSVYEITGLDRAFSVRMLVIVGLFTCLLTSVTIHSYSEATIINNDERLGVPLKNELEAPSSNFNYKELKDTAYSAIA